MTKPFTVTDDMRQLMDAARAAFAEDTGLAVEVARHAAGYLQRHRELPTREDVPAPPPPHECPSSHEHGSDRCAFRDRCACEVCEDSRQQRAAKRRQDALQRHQARPVTVTHVQPTKVAPEGTQPGRYVKGSRPITSVDRTPKALPDGVEHGGHRAYQVHRCRCAECRAWKAETARKSRIRAAERAALQQWSARRPDDD